MRIITRRPSCLLFAAIMVILVGGAFFQLTAQDAGGSDPGDAPLIPRGAISGRVEGIDSSVIGEAGVVAIPADPIPVEWGKTFVLIDSQFTYRLDSLAAGAYLVMAEAPGYIPQFYPGTTEWLKADTINVLAGEVTAGINFSLERGARSRGGAISGLISGRDQHPLPNINVVASTLFIPDSGKIEYIDIGKALSDENGYYLIQELPAADYYVRADSWNAWSGQTLWYNQATTPSEARPVTVWEDQETSGINFNFAVSISTGRIYGQVVDALGLPISDAGIQLTPAPDQADPYTWIWLYASTDASGRFEIENVPNGNYVAYCWAQSGWEYAQRWWPGTEDMAAATVISISAAQPAWQIDFKMPLAAGRASLSGVVKATIGRTLANTQIQITTAEKTNDDVTGRYFYAYAYTDSNGYYQVSKLPEGQYIAYASYWEGESFGQAWYKDADSLGGAEPITLTDGEDRRDINFTLNVHPIYGAIVGLVTDSATGDPIPRAYIQVQYQRKFADLSISYRRFAWWPFYTITDENGQFVFDGLPEGDYTVAAYANGGFAWYPDARVEELATPVTLTGGQKTAVDFKLTLEKKGESVITGFVKADYSIMPMRTAGTKNMRLESVQDEYVPEIAIVMAKPAVTIMLYPFSEFFYTAVTDPDGAYALKGLPAGEYYVSSFAPGHMLQYYKETFDPAEADLVTVGPNEVINGIDFNLAACFWYGMKENDSAGRNNLNANLSGIITDENGEGVAGAGVYLLDTQGQPVSWTTCDQNGRYEIFGVAAGQYYIQAGKLGFSTTFNGDAANREATTPLFAYNGIMEVNITLRPAATTEVEVQILPDKVELRGNYPNPFNPETRIHFALPQPMHVTLNIYDLLGRQVRRLYDGILHEGEHRLFWDGRADGGQLLGSGVYWYRLITPQATRTAKMVMMK